MNAVNMSGENAKEFQMVDWLFLFIEVQSYKD
jgi:hypothetical protein